MSDAPPALYEAPPSCKLVHRVLREQDDLSTEELSDETMLPETTVSKALRRLRDMGVVEMRHGTADARETYYSLTEA